MSAATASLRSVAHRPPQSSGPLWFVGLAIIAVAALLLRAIALGDSLWLDELHTSWVVGNSLSEVAPRAAAGNQAPLFYWAVWALVQIVPANEVTLRAASWLASGGLVAAVGHVARRWTGDAALGLLAAALVAADANCVYYGREARPYAWVALLALLHVVVFRRRLTIANRPDRHAQRCRLRGAWIALSWALFYTHYTSLLLVVAQLVYVALTRHGRRACRRRQVGSWLVDSALIVVGCLPALTVIEQIAERRDNWSQFVKPQGIVALGTLFPCKLYVGAPIVVAVLLVAWYRRRGWPVSTRRLHSFLPLLGCWYLVPVGLAWAVTYAGLAPLLHRRYVWLAAVPLFLHAALWGTVATRRLDRRLFAGLVVLMAAIYWWNEPRSTWQKHSREDWRSALAVVGGDERSFGWPVLLRAGLIEDRQLSASSSAEFREYCTFALRGLYSIADRPGPLIALPSDGVGQLEADTRDRMTAARGAWLVYRGSSDRAQQVIERWQAEFRPSGIAVHTLRRHAFPGVTVIAVRLARIPSRQ